MNSESVGGVQRWHKEMAFNPIEDKKEEENTLKKKKRPIGNRDHRMKFKHRVNHKKVWPDEIYLWKLFSYW